MQTAVFTSTSKVTTTRQCSLYALHSCQENKDYYLVNTGGDWTATEAAWFSASTDAGQLHLSNPKVLKMPDHFSDGTQWCEGRISGQPDFGRGQGASLSVRCYIR